jgi:PqqD family protein of HPr-rel-A system
MADQYAAAPGVRMLDFGDEWIVFNPLSWDAHLLNAAAAVVLEQLSAQPQTEAEVADYLRDLLMDAERAHALTSARRLLGELVQLGLVRLVAADATHDR